MTLLALSGLCKNVSKLAKVTQMKGLGEAILVTALVLEPDAAKICKVVTVRDGVAWKPDPRDSCCFWTPGPGPCAVSAPPNRRIDPNPLLRLHTGKAMSPG